MSCVYLYHRSQAGFHHSEPREMQLYVGDWCTRYYSGYQVRILQSRAVLLLTGMVDEKWKNISNKTQYPALRNQPNALSFCFSFSFCLFLSLCLSLFSYFPLSASSKHFFFLPKKVDPPCKYMCEVQGVTE